MSNRAERRAKLQALKALARKRQPDNPKAEHNADHMAACSCPMCGNPRRHFGERTIQERRADDGEAA